jgi:hypothetical protein
MTPPVSKWWGDASWSFATASVGVARQYALARPQSVAAPGPEGLGNRARSGLALRAACGRLSRSARFWVRRVWLWDARPERRARPRLLIVRRKADGHRKYSLSNTPADTASARLGDMQAQRIFIVRAFQDTKSEMGLAHDEVRGWRGWHHHIDQCCFALLFALSSSLSDFPPRPE